MVDFLYFKGCPNAKETLNNLYDLIEEGFISKNDLSVIEVPDIVKAEEYSFQGSPTILYNGVDIYTKSKPEGVHYSCRLFSISGKQTGFLTKEYIKEAITGLSENRESDSTT